MGCALSAEILGVGGRRSFRIDWQSIVYTKALCAEWRRFGSQGTVTEDSSELGGALSYQRKFTKEWCREDGRLQDGEGLSKEGSGEDSHERVVNERLEEGA